MADDERRRHYHRDWDHAVRDLATRVGRTVPTDGRIRWFKVHAAERQMVTSLGQFWVECGVGWQARATRLLAVEVGRLGSPFDGALQVAVEAARTVEMRLTVASQEKVEVNRYLVNMYKAEARRYANLNQRMFKESALVIAACASTLEAASGRPAAKNESSRMGDTLDSILERLAEIMRPASAADGGNAASTDGGAGVQQDTMEDQDDDVFDAWSFGGFDPPSE